MNYAVKIRHAEKVAEDLLNEQSIEEVSQNLKENGLYDRDISNVIASARNIIGDNLKPSIRAKILAGESIKNAKEFEKLDAETLERFVIQELKGITVSEKKKVNELLKAGAAPEDIFKVVRQEFYPRELITRQIDTFKAVKMENSVGGRLIKIVLGAGLVIIGGGISFASIQGSQGGVLLYGMVMVGLIMLVRGFVTTESPFD